MPWGRTLAQLDRWILLQLPGRSRVRAPPRLFKDEISRLAEWWFRRGLLVDRILWCSVLLQCVAAVYCSVLQCVAVCCSGGFGEDH